MLDNRKIRPDDGSEEEKKWEEEQEKKKQKELSEEEELERFVTEAEKNRDKIDEQKREELEKLKRGRKKTREEEEGEQNESDKDNQKLIYGEKVKPQRVFIMDKGFGIFSKKGEREKFGTEKVERKMNKLLRSEAHGVSTKKQREFVQLLNKFHGYKKEKTGTLEKDEILSFEAGLRRGYSDDRFKALSTELKKEGLIKNSSDIRKFFKRTELKKMSNAILGREDVHTYKRIDKTDLINRRSGSSDSNSGLTKHN